jgi:hypothetical protein
MDVPSEDEWIGMLTIGQSGAEAEATVKALDDNVPPLRLRVTINRFASDGDQTYGEMVLFAENESRVWIDIQGRQEVYRVESHETDRTINPQTGRVGL